MKNLEATFSQYEFKKNSEVVEATKILKFRQLWAAKGVNPATLPQAEIAPLVKAEMTHENLFKVLELSGLDLSRSEFDEYFGNWYKI